MNQENSELSKIRGELYSAKAALDEIETVLKDMRLSQTAMITAIYQIIDKFRNKK